MKNTINVFEITKQALENRKKMADLWRSLDHENINYKDVVDSYFQLHDQTHSEEIKGCFVDSVEYLTIEPNTIDLAVHIFLYINELILTNKLSTFEMEQKPRIDDRLRVSLTKGVHFYSNYNRGDKYKEFGDGILAFCKYHSDKLEKMGLKGFIVKREETDKLKEIQQELVSLKNRAAKMRGKYGYSLHKELVELALNRNELTMLLSADPAYIYDADGGAWLAYDSKWDFPDPYEPVNIHVIANWLLDVYRECEKKDCLRKAEFEQTLAVSLLEMVNGTPEQIYWATYILKRFIENEAIHYEFAEYTKQDCFADNLREIFTTAIKDRKNEMKNAFPYKAIGYKEGLWDYCCSISKKLEERNLPGFMPSDN